VLILTIQHVGKLHNVDMYHSSAYIIVNLSLPFNNPLDTDDFNQVGRI